MADVATPELLSHLKNLYPAQSESSYVESPWYAVAAIAFSASNCPDAVPLVFKYVLDDLEAISASHTDRLAATRKIRDAVFKSGMICGYPKVINALLALHQATPTELQDKKTLRPDPSIEELVDAGMAYFNQTYGDTAQSTDKLLRDIYPDLGYMTTTFGYGYAYAFMDVTSAMETSFTMIAALIAIDVPRQVEWHLKGAMRNGASEEQVRAVRAIAIEASKAAGVCWKHDIPSL